MTQIFGLRKSAKIRNQCENNRLILTDDKFFLTTTDLTDSHRCFSIDDKFYFAKVS